jgi:hypothetical protein
MIWIKTEVLRYKKPLWEIQISELVVHSGWWVLLAHSDPFTANTETHSTPRLGATGSPQLHVDGQLTDRSSAFPGHCQQSTATRQAGFVGSSLLLRAVIPRVWSQFPVANRKRLAHHRRAGFFIFYWYIKHDGNYVARVLTFHELQFNLQSQIISNV